MVGAMSVVVLSSTDEVAMAMTPEEMLPNADGTIKRLVRTHK